MKFRSELIGKTLLLSRWDLDMVSRCRQIADDTAALGIKWWGPERSADEFHRDWFGFLIRKGEESFGGFSVNELDAENLHIGEGSASGDGE